MGRVFTSAEVGRAKHLLRRLHYRGLGGKIVCLDAYPEGDEDQVEMWVNIEYHPDWFSRDAVEADAEATWELTP